MKNKKIYYTLLLVIVIMLSTLAFNSSPLYDGLSDIDS